MYAAALPHPIMIRFRNGYSSLVSLAYVPHRGGQRKSEQLFTSHTQNLDSSAHLGQELQRLLKVKQDLS